MAQFAGGFLRFAVRGAGGNVRTWSDPVSYDILDNTAAPLVYARDASPQRLSYGTINDFFLNVPRDCVASGANGEMLVVQFLHSAAMTPATASFTVQLGVAEIYVNAQTKKVEIQDKILRAADRATR